MVQSQIKIDLAEIEEKLSLLQNQVAELSTTNKKLSSRVRELELLFKTNGLLSRTLDKDETISSLKDFFSSNFDLNEYSLLLKAENSNNFYIASSFGIRPNLKLPDNIERANTPFEKAIENGAPLYIADTTEFSYPFSRLGHNNNGSLLILPLLFYTEKESGIINLFRNGKDKFSPDEIKLFSHLAAQIAGILDKTFLYQHAKELAYTDGLTGIFNRRYFDQRFQREILRARRYKRTLSILMVDIDHFKKYNDTVGHLLGDEVLRRVAKLLENNLRRADIICRYGGEEFVVILPEIDLKHAALVAEKLRQTVLHTSFPGEEKLPLKQLTISIGVAAYPENGKFDQEVLDKADQALYQAKRKGRNQVVTSG